MFPMPIVHPKTNSEYIPGNSILVGVVLPRSYPVLQIKAYPSQFGVSFK